MTFKLIEITWHGWISNTYTRNSYSSRWSQTNCILRQSVHQSGENCLSIKMAEFPQLPFQINDSSWSLVINQCFSLKQYTRSTARTSSRAEVTLQVGQRSRTILAATTSSMAIPATDGISYTNSDKYVSGPPFSNSLLTFCCYVVSW